ncbi:hypothetical protein N7494_004557 [Penicillium frequentans]|uniref:Uncharacterized protein n=1 Tax=Penicillium frequentans TaxID=3151616 RepID=A0AAD6GHE9_9EURO|nr:hypothetical protein N7494_004557 [Penicillium glabrum]
MADPIPPQFRDNESWLWIQEATVEIYYPGTSVIRVSWPIDSLQDCRYRDDLWLRADSIDYWTLMNLLDTYSDTIPWDDNIHELCWSPIKPGPENGYLVNQSHHNEVLIDEDNFALTMVEAIDTFCGYRPQPGGRPYRGEISIYCVVRPKGYCSIGSGQYSSLAEPWLENVSFEVADFLHQYHLRMQKT